MQWKNEEKREEREEREARKKKTVVSTQQRRSLEVELQRSTRTVFAKEANKQKQTTTYFGRLSDVVSFFEIF